jgi:hypothetical protein
MVFKNNMFVKKPQPPSSSPQPFSIVSTNVFRSPKITTTNHSNSILKNSLNSTGLLKYVHSNKNNHNSGGNRTSTSNIPFMIDLTPLEGIKNEEDINVIKHITISAVGIKYPSSSMLFWAIDQSVETYDIVCVYPCGTVFHDFELIPIRKIDDRIIDVWLDISRTNVKTIHSNRGMGGKSSGESPSSSPSKNRFD